MANNEMTVIPTMQPDGALEIKIECDEYASMEHFLDREGLKNAIEGVKEGIRRGHYKDIRLIAFFEQPRDTKNVDIVLTRFDGTKVEFQEPILEGETRRHYFPDSQASH